MSCGKYSPTVTYWYSKDQQWWKKNGGDAPGPEFLYDYDGYDSYGYNEDGRDRAGHHEDDYLFDEDLYENVMWAWIRNAAPVKETVGSVKRELMKS
jgi:hypothetical protein